ncbi:LCCL domain-containing protein [Iamia majanohamensis]|uniref:LCCL domain-containing protein n=1 Tax=Iamia majanohamensis TaxID=467976 RepID=A0AAE9Y744_9ACTN|nr:LCCL domain-containing protein [Iamia majanohamensis]WCO65519.1 LCCL domain-containing protein [Iamia majanohamensis]
MTHRRRTVVALLSALALVLALAACGGDDDATEDTEDAPIATSDGSTEADGGSATTTGEGDEPRAGTEDDGSGDEGGGEDDGGDGEPIAGSDDDLPADEEAEGDGWAENPSQFRGRDGLRVAYACEPGGDLRTVWGTDTYTDDSSVCTAAVHQGVITQEDGGRVVVEIAPGQDSYEGTEANGVGSNDYGEWGGSFTFPTA